MTIVDVTAPVSALWSSDTGTQGWQPLVLPCRAVCSRDKEWGRREPNPAVAGFVFSAIFWHLSFQIWVYPRDLTLKRYHFFYLGCFVLLFYCCFQNPPLHSVGQRSSLWYMLSLSVSFPLYFFLIVPSTRPVANPSQPRAHPGAGQESSTTANARALAIVVEQQECCKSRTAM